MYQQEVTIGSIFDKYSNPIAEIVQKACTYQSDLHAMTEKSRINLKSIMGIMAFKWDEGSVISIVGEGEDAESAVQDICKYIACK